MIAFTLTCAIALFAMPTGQAATHLTPQLSERIDRAARDLQSRQFVVRQAASRNLQSCGEAAIPTLEEIAKSPDREARMRALDVLKIHERGSETNAASLARAALTRLAEDADHPAGRLAADILENRPAKERERLRQEGEMLRRILVQNPGIQLQLQIQRRAQPMGRAAPRQRPPAAIGISSISVSDNGNGSLNVRIVNGKVQSLRVTLPDGTRKSYETLADVKKNHPQLYERYEVLAKKNGHPTAE